MMKITGTRNTQPTLRRVSRSTTHELDQRFAECLCFVHHIIPIDAGDRPGHLLINTWRIFLRLEPEEPARRVSALLTASRTLPPCSFTIPQSSRSLTAFQLRCAVWPHRPPTRSAQRVPQPPAPVGWLSCQLTSRLRSLQVVCGQSTQGSRARCGRRSKPHPPKHDTASAYILFMKRLTALSAASSITRSPRCQPRPGRQASAERPGS